jgi:hypothetical protein
MSLNEFKSSKWVFSVHFIGCIIPWLFTLKPNV